MMWFWKCRTGGVFSKCLLWGFLFCKHAYLACRLLFLSSDGTSVSSIHRVSLSGNDMINILKTTERIKAISLDLIDTRLYWIQHDLGKEISHIGSCDYDGGAVRFLRNPVRWVFLSLQKWRIHFRDAVKLSSSFCLLLGQFTTWGV